VVDPWRFDSERADRVAAEAGAPEVMADAAEGPSVVAGPGSLQTSAAQSLEQPEDGSQALSETQVDEAPPVEPETADQRPGWRLSRRLKRQQKSARARKDKLRSATEPKPPPVAAPPPKPQQGGWLVNPDRAAAFAPPVPDTAQAPAPPVIGRPAPAPVQVHPAPMPPVQPVVAPPVAAAIPMPVYGAPSPPAPPVQPVQVRPVTAAPAPAPTPVAPVGAPLRLKAEPPAGYAPQRSRAPISAVPYVHRAPMFEAEAPRSFPWKLAIAAVLIVAIAAVVGRAYLPSRTGPEAEPPAPAAASRPEPEPVAAVPKGQAGEILIQTQPAGARVLLDGKPAGQTPLKLANVPAGRHVLTFVSSAGEVTRTVRVTAGKAVSLDIPIFSGWVAIFAPIVLEVAVDGRSLGTTEQERLMLPPGRHELTLSNKELGYKAVKEVEVEPGEVRSVTIEPRGEVNFNAIPWAEVLMDGKTLGDTPIANVRVPLGMREFVFKHPQHGERRVTASIRADQPSAIGVDFTRPQ
jgi:hypothetical protein